MGKGSYCMKVYLKKYFEDFREALQGWNIMGHTCMCTVLKFNNRWIPDRAITTAREGRGILITFHSSCLQQTKYRYNCLVGLLLLPGVDLR